MARGETGARKKQTGPSRLDVSCLNINSFGVCVNQIELAVRICYLLLLLLEHTGDANTRPVILRLYLP